MKTLAQRSIVSIRATDFGFYTQGNSRLTGPVLVDPANTAAGVAASRTPASGYRSLRDADNVFITPTGGLIEWAPNQVKINYKNQNYLNEYSYRIDF